MVLLPLSSLLLLSLSLIDSDVKAFSLVHLSCHGSQSNGIVSSGRRKTTTLLKNALYDNDDEVDDDDDDFIDTDSLGDWRDFRRNLAFDAEETSPQKSSKVKTKSVSKENEDLLLSQNKELGEEYISDVWAHETSTVSDSSFLSFKYFVSILTRLFFDLKD